MLTYLLPKSDPEYLQWLRQKKKKEKEEKSALILSDSEAPSFSDEKNKNKISHDKETRKDPRVTCHNVCLKLENEKVTQYFFFVNLSSVLS